MLCNVIQRYFLCCEPSVTIKILPPSHPSPPLPSLSCLQSLPCSPSVNTSTLQPFKLYATLSPFDFIYSLCLPLGRQVRRRKQKVTGLGLGPDQSGWRARRMERRRQEKRQLHVELRTSPRKKCPDPRAGGGRNLCQLLADAEGLLEGSGQPRGSPYWIAKTYCTPGAREANVQSGTCLVIDLCEGLNIFFSLSHVAWSGGISSWPAILPLISLVSCSPLPVLQLFTPHHLPLSAKKMLDWNVC